MHLIELTMGRSPHRKLDSEQLIHIAKAQRQNKHTKNKHKKNERKNLVMYRLNVHMQTDIDCIWIARGEGMINPDHYCCFKGTSQQDTDKSCDQMMKPPIYNTSKVHISWRVKSRPAISWPAGRQYASRQSPLVDVCAHNRAILICLGNPTHRLNCAHINRHSLFIKHKP